MKRTCGVPADRQPPTARPTLSPHSNELHCPLAAPSASAGGGLLHGLQACARSHKGVYGKRPASRSHPSHLRRCESGRLCRTSISAARRLLKQARRVFTRDPVAFMARSHNPGCVYKRFIYLLFVGALLLARFQRNTMN